MEEIFKIIDDFIKEEDCYRVTDISGKNFDITENNLKLLRKLKRRIKKHLTQNKAI